MDLPVAHRADGDQRHVERVERRIMLDETKPSVPPATISTTAPAIRTPAKAMHAVAIQLQGTGNPGAVSYRPGVAAPSPEAARASHAGMGMADQQCRRENPKCRLLTCRRSSGSPDSRRVIRMMLELIPDRASMPG